MNQASKRKVEMILPMEEAGAFLKKLGEDMEQGTLLIGDTSIDLKGFKSLGISIKEEGGDLRVKLKVKFPKEELPAQYAEGDEEAEAEADEILEALYDEDEDILVPEPEDEYSSLATRPRPKYKSLKKRMKAQFKAIMLALQQGSMPDKALVHAFARDSELMITYPGKGDEYYKDYEAALQKFLVAVTQGDLEALRESVAELDHCKKVCHDKYE